jgi:hypothetical protein
VFAGTRELRIEPQPDGTVLVTHVEDVTGLRFPCSVPRWGVRSRSPTTAEPGPQGARRRPDTRVVPGREEKGTNALPLSTYTAVGGLRQDPCPPAQSTADVGFSRGTTGGVDS